MASAVVANNSSFTSPLADAKFAQFVGQSHINGLITQISELSPWTVLLTIFLCMVAYDQCSYLWQKGSIEGPSWKAPFTGPFLQSVRPNFEEYKGKWASGPLSCVSVFHKFVVIASDRDLARKIFNSPSFVKPCVVDAAHKLLGKTNWVFLDGKAHVDFRKGLNGLFTRQALETYLPGQEDVYNDYFARFLKVSKDADGPFPFMGEFRELMCAVSCRTFVGHYISDEAVKKIADDYYNITAAMELVNFPIILPFTKSWYGKIASDMVMEEFSKCAAKSKVRMAAGGDVTCIMDAWIKSILDSKTYREREEKGLSMEGIEKPTPLLREFTDYEIAQTVFTFLFASQDATSSACTWLFQTMAQRPDCLDKIREENLRVRNGNRDAPCTMEMMDDMVYTRAAVRELLRYRPPVIMVPYLAKKPFPISDTYTVPKGAMIIPAVYPALRDPEIYENPDYFDPDRYVTGDAETKGAKNYLVFGTGPHYCLGQVYAQNNLALMIGKASMHLDWVHHATPLSEEIKVFATIFPMDDCPLTFTKRPA